MNNKINMQCIDKREKKNQSYNHEMRVHFGDSRNEEDDLPMRRTILKHTMKAMLDPLDKLANRNIVLEIKSHSKEIETKLSKNLPSTTRSVSNSKIKQTIQIFPRLTYRERRQIEPLKLEYKKMNKLQKLQLSATYFSSSRNTPHDHKFTESRKLIMIPRRAYERVRQLNLKTFFYPKPPYQSVITNKLIEQLKCITPTINYSSSLVAKSSNEIMKGMM